MPTRRAPHLAAALAALASATLASALAPAAPTTTAAASAVLDAVCDWAVALDVGSNVLKGLDAARNPLNASIFINGNLARALLASHALAANATRRDAALRWCDTLLTLQAAEGYWGAGYPAVGPVAGDMYFGDTGTAVQALALCRAEAAKRGDGAAAARYLGAHARYLTFVTRGSRGVPEGRPPPAPATGWVTKGAYPAAAVGCGYYKGHLSTAPYVIASATTGAAAGSELYAALGAVGEGAAARPHLRQGKDAPPLGVGIGLSRDEAKRLAAGTLEYISSLVSAANGSVPYVIDGEPADWVSWPFDTMTYVFEGAIAADLAGSVSTGEVARALEPCVRFIVRAQNDDGSWGALGSSDQQRSPRVATALAWWLTRVDPADEQAAAALTAYVKFIAGGPPKAYGLLALINTLGFTAFWAADMLRFGVTFGRRTSPPLPARLDSD